MRSLLVVLFGLLVLVTCVPARDVGPAARGDAAAWAACEGTLCRRVQDEAEGLARVKLLRSYVVETVRLLDHLMESMDNELIEIAEEMRDFVGPRCQGAHAILATVVEKRPKSGDDDLSAGIMEESTAQRLEERQGSTQDIADGIVTEIQRSDDNSWSTPDSGQSSSSREPWSASSSPTSQSSGSGRELYNGVSQSTLPNQVDGQHSSGWVIVDNDPWSRESRDNDNYAGSGNQYGGRPGGGPGNSYSNKPPRNDANSGQENVWRPSSGPLSNKDRQGSQRGGGCRGLPDSPFAVPGIDSWCAVNCGRGYCPPTHCICD